MVALPCEDTPGLHLTRVTPCAEDDLSGVLGPADDAPWTGLGDAGTDAETEREEGSNAISEAAGVSFGEGQGVDALDDDETAASLATRAV